MSQLGKQRSPFNYSSSDLDDLRPMSEWVRRRLASFDEEAMPPQPSTSAGRGRPSRRQSSAGLPERPPSRSSTSRPSSSAGGVRSRSPSLSSSSSDELMPPQPSTSTSSAELPERPPSRSSTSRPSSSAGRVVRSRRQSSAGRMLLFFDDSDELGDKELRPIARVERDPDFHLSSSEDDLDYVSVVDTTLDADEPLARYLERIVYRNAPGTPNFRWRKKDNFPRKVAFSGDPGFKVPLTVESTPLDIFSYLMTDDVIDHIVSETNLYAVARPPAASPHMRRWTPTSRQEVKAYFGLRLLMGMVRLPSFRDYWSTDPGFRQTLMTEVMTRDRFDQLTTHLHFAHLEEGAPLPEDRMWKLRPVVDALNESFRTIFVSGQDITVDESLWKFRGRLAFRTYNPTKRARFGLKVYKLSTSTGLAAGYTSCFKVYTGQDRGDMPSSTKAVFHLMEYGGFLDKGYQLFVDSWYTSPTFFNLLQSRKTNAVGTARLNRKFMPKDLSVRRKGDVDYRSSRTGLLALLWKDNAVVALLSTVHNAAMSA
ncbi:hypothetical protein C7M84_018134 [Penaeus vannamei]|uniref:PiggyBac transposable element-derived protein domain-containing protein n=1 Tax=Penaeus vannamei TaxID=6689 RepID=A0A3R7M0G3_PENVA|nr:hypothetical protein C7M84_018134 [Penaeus vannamei]